MTAMSSVNAADINATAAFIDGFLVPHNQARNAVGVGPLQWDRKLANYARNYARQRRGDCLLQHSDSPFGENIFWGSGHAWTPSQAVAAWIDEKKWFDYAKNIHRKQALLKFTRERIFEYEHSSSYYIHSFNTNILCTCNKYNQYSFSEIRWQLI